MFSTKSKGEEYDKVSVIVMSRVQTPDCPRCKSSIDTSQTKIAAAAGRTVCKCPICKTNVMLVRPSIKEIENPLFIPHLCTKFVPTSLLPVFPSIHDN
ncbi:MAG: hypothetical protein V3575_02980 [Candidatus Absconditabacteria bacterium]